jgi:hypothetical protein
MDKTDLSLLLAAFSALAVISAPIAALTITAFLAGYLAGRQRHPPP